MRFEVEPNQYVLRVYDDDKSSDNYVATALIRTYGDRAYMSSISSPRLFEALAEHLDNLLEKLKIVTLEGYMSPVMARAVRIKCKGWAHFEITHYGTCAGRRMPWVIVSSKKHPICIANHEALEE